MRTPSPLALGLWLASALAALCSAHAHAEPQGPQSDRQAGAPSSAAAVSERDLAAAGKRYRGQCAACHTPPDARFETDRAWLGRLPETT